MALEYTEEMMICKSIKLWQAIKKYGDGAARFFMQAIKANSKSVCMVSIIDIINKNYLTIYTG